MNRTSNRATNQLRNVTIHRHFLKYAEGSVLIEYGQTRIICTASVQDSVPDFLKDKKQGWLTAEYGMLPRATHSRNAREAAKGKQSGRTQEIQRLIGRALRAVFELEALGKRTIQIDCDVIQADGGTRTASITGAFVAAHDAVTHLLNTGQITQSPIKDHVAAISVGMIKQTPLLDLDYMEDVQCDNDVNVVMTGSGKLIEIQGTAEGETFSKHELQQLIDLAEKGIQTLIDLQKSALNTSSTE